MTTNNLYGAKQFIGTRFIANAKCSSLLFRHSLGFSLKHLGDCWPCSQTIVPCGSQRVLFLHIERISHQFPHKRIPWHPCQICVSALTSNQILCALLLQVCLDYAEYALDLVAVPLKGGWDLFRMEHGEPCPLSKVRALPRHLEVKPALGKVFLLGIRVGELIALIVLLNQILNDRTGLEEVETRVWVLYGRDTAIRVERDERFLLDGTEVEELGVIRKAKLL